MFTDIYTVFIKKKLDTEMSRAVWEDNFLCGHLDVFIEKRSDTEMSMSFYVEKFLYIALFYLTKTKNRLPFLYLGTKLASSFSLFVYLDVCRKSKLMPSLHTVYLYTAFAAGMR